MATFTFASGNIRGLRRIPLYLLGSLVTYLVPRTERIWVFGSGIGLKLMMLESEILISALGKLAAANISALPLHDSVIVARSEAARAQTILEGAFAEFIPNARARITIDFG